MPPGGPEPDKRNICSKLVAAYRMEGYTEHRSVGAMRYHALTPMRLRTMLFGLLWLAAPLAAQTQWVATWATSPAPQLPDAAHFCA